MRGIFPHLKRKVVMQFVNKDLQISTLEHQLLQMQKAKELLNLEYIKLQKSSEIKFQNLELLNKKQINSNCRIGRIDKKVKSSQQEIKKNKKARRKDAKYHSDTEDIIDISIK